MSGTWAIARQMIAEGIRMKIALVFLVLIALVVLGLPFSIAGDSSLSGAVQSFMTYGLTATGLLLGMLTIFLSRSVADELVQRQILLIMAKPLPRWQYVVGKWLGITILNVSFLAVSGVTIYAMVHYIKWTHPPIDDRYDEAELTHEILVARHALQARLPDFKKPAQLEFERNVTDGLYDDVPDFKPEVEKARLATKYEMRWRIVGPQEMRVFEFENILCDRSAGKYIQVRYKTEVTGYPPDEILRAIWRFGDPMEGTPVYNVPVRHVVGRFHTVRVPADAVTDDHKLTAYFLNENPFRGEPQYETIMEFRRSNEVEVLFIVGSFEWNLVRLLILTMCKLMFLAAVAILMVIVFSFPVACLASFTVYVLAGTRSFILEALDFASDDYATMFVSAKEFFLQTVQLLYHVLHWVIPDFARYNAIEDLVNGRNVSLTWVLNGVLWLVVVKTTVVLGSAILLFHRREVAEVSF